MAGIPQNTNYSNPNTKLMPIISAIAKMGKSFGARRPDVSRFQGVANSVKNYNPSQNVSTKLSDLGTISTPFMGQTRFESQHPGVDIANKIGTPIPAFTQGVVAKVEQGHKQGEKNYGNYVIIIDPQGNQQRYSHLNRAYVNVGQRVTPGMQLGEMGNTGNTYSNSGGDSSHLDYRIKNMYNKYISPYSFIKG